MKTNVTNRGSDPIATATGGIDGMPVWEPEERRQALWRLSKSVDAQGNDTLVFSWYAGMTVILR